MKHPIQEMMEQRRQGKKCGIPSYCTANPLVLEIILRRAKLLQTPVLIEATADLSSGNISAFLNNSLLAAANKKYLEV